MRIEVQRGEIGLVWKACLFYPFTKFDGSFVVDNVLDVTPRSYDVHGTFGDSYVERSWRCIRCSFRIHSETLII